MPTYEEYGFPNRPRRHRGSSTPWMIVVPLIVVLILGGIGVGWYLSHDGKPANDPDAQPREVTPRGDRDSLEKERIRVFKDSSPGVVNVDTLRVQRAGYIGGSQQQGTGSGFVWDEDGRIVTNFHVVQDALQFSASGSVSYKPSTEIRVIMADRSSWPAELVGIAPDNDLAVLQIRAPREKLKPLKVGSSSDLEVGQTVYAIGNPFGQSLTFTHGIVSALDREIASVTDRPITGVIQTDAPLNPGNSGGPLLDREGRLIGVNTAITSPTGGSVGLGYAIPVDTVNRVVPQLIRTGRDAKPSLGVVLLSEKDTRALKINQGVMIAEVRENSAAEKAGLRGFTRDPRTGRNIHGDVILAIDGEKVDGVRDFERIMSKLKVQQAVKLTILRNGETKEVTVVLEGF